MLTLSKLHGLLRCCNLALAAGKISNFCSANLSEINEERKTASNENEIVKNSVSCVDGIDLTNTFKT